MFTRSAGQNAGESFEGTIQMKGDKFTLVTPDALTWFNGTTQWTYVERNDEVNVTNLREKSCNLQIPLFY